MLRTRMVWIIAVAILLFFLATTFFLDLKGRSARSYGERVHDVSETQLPVTMIASSGELYRLYKSRGVQGRLLVHIGTHLHFVDGNDDKGPFSPLPRPDALGVLHAYEQRIDYTNVFWVAMQANIVRGIYYVLPDQVYQEIRKAAREDDFDIAYMDTERIVAHEWGFRREISNSIPVLPEPVLLNIDASVFEYREVSDILRMVKQSRLKADLITANLSEDSPDVSPASRGKMRLFISLLTGGGSGKQ